MALIYYLLYYIATFCIPFVVYFLLFKRNNGRSLYTGRDWFHLIKLYYAKKEVERYQERYRKRFNNEKNSLEENETPTEKHSNTQSLFGVDQKGNSISLKFTLRHGNIAEVNLCLRLSDGRCYTFPGNDHAHRSKISKQNWKTNGLNIETLEPYKRFRVVFNGLLQNVAVKDETKIEHVQLNLIFNASGSPTYIPHGLDAKLLAEAVARETWRDGSWRDYLVDQSGYEQFGALQGFVKGDSFSSEFVLNLASVRTRLRGLDDTFLLKRALRIFIADTYGNLINVVVKSFTNGCSQLNYGSAILSNNVILPISGLDIMLKNVGVYKVFPDTLTMHIRVKSKLFICVIHLNKSKCVASAKGYECYNIPAECDLNKNQGHAILEFWYSKKGGDEKFDYNNLLCDKNVDILPDILISRIDSEESKILALTGGKGNSLALLAGEKSTEYIIPDGFIITVNAFKLQLESNPKLSEVVSLLNDISCGKKTGKLVDICNETVDCFKMEKILPDIVDAIVNELKSFNGGETIAWAVRSSAVGEDSDELSAAGQNETFLGCMGVDQVLKSVSSCWASLFTFQSVQYRREHGLPVLAPMAVVVQKMVPADAAGVLFTCHPTTSNPSQMVITSNFGLGESVVSGSSDPDTFIIARTWDDKLSLTDSIAGDKNKIITMTNFGVQEIDNEISEFELVDPHRWSITQEQALRLGQIGVRLERAFGCPRDIEFAFYKDELYLLQSRPITTLNSWSEFELTHEMDYPIISDKLVFTVGNIGEVIPNSITVLSQTSTVSIIDRAMQEQAQRHYDPLVSKAVCIFRHKAMLEIISTIHRNVHSEVKMSSKIMDVAIFGHSVLDDTINRLALDRLGLTSAYSQLLEVLNVLRAARNSNKMYEKVRERAMGFEINVRESDTLLEIYTKIGDSFDELHNTALFHPCTSAICVFYEVIAMTVLCGGAKELTAEHFSDFAMILSSCEDVISAEIPMYLEKIARIIRDEGYNEEFCTIEPQFGVTWLKTKCPEAYKVFEEFLERHGHRNLGEFEVMEESWAENPSKVIPMIQANAKYEKSIGKNSITIDEMVKKLVSPKNAVARYILKFLTKKIRSAVGLRELSKSELVRSLNVLRQAYRDLAHRMVLQGLLPSTDLIYHLTHYEIGVVIQSRNPLLITKAIKRQRLYPKWCKLNFPEIMLGTPVPEIEDSFRIDSSSIICTGTPVCTGSVTARACVIRKLDEIDQLQLGDILVTYSTDIGWSPYFPMLSGIVTELGGLISHGAVVAREYGLPSIVGVKNATKIFKTGDVLVLSANTGEIGRV